MVNVMLVKEDMKANVKKIVELLPKTNCGKCGYDNCGKFAKAVAEGNVSPFGCIENPAAGYRISDVLGIEVPQQQADNASMPQMTPEYGTRRIKQTRKPVRKQRRLVKATGPMGSRLK